MEREKFTKIIDPMKSQVKYSSIQVFEYSSIQVFKYSSIQVFRRRIQIVLVVFEEIKSMQIQNIVLFGAKK